MLEQNVRKTEPTNADAGQPKIVPLFAFVAAKSAISALFVATFAIGYLAGDLAMPGLQGITGFVLKAVAGGTCNGVLFFRMTTLTPATVPQISEVLDPYDGLAHLSVHLLPYISSFAAAILAVVLLLTIRPELDPRGLAALCVVALFTYQSSIDRFLCGRFQR